MDCPTCHQLNPDNAATCSLCGTMLLRPATAGGEAEEPLIGLSYSSQAPDTMGLKIHAQKALVFVLSALAMQLALAVMLVNGPLVANYFEVSHLLESVSGPSLRIALGAYALFVFAWCVGKTSQASTAGFWGNFALALVPPLIPAALARVGGRSVLWTYIYLALDALVIAMTLQFFHVAPMVGVLVLLAALPLASYHLSGCAIGSIAQSIGLNPYFATVWLLAGPLAYFMFGLSQTGMAMTFVNAMIGDTGAPTVESLLRLLDFGMVTRDFTAYATAVIWGGLGWIFWLKSVYESMKYPLS